MLPVQTSYAELLEFRSFSIARMREFVHCCVIVVLIITMVNGAINWGPAPRRLPSDFRLNSYSLLMNILTNDELETLYQLQLAIVGNSIYFNYYTYYQAIQRFHKKITQPLNPTPAGIELGGFLIKNVEIPARTWNLLGRPCSFDKTRRYWRGFQTIPEIFAELQAKGLQPEDACLIDDPSLIPILQCYSPPTSAYIEEEYGGRCVCAFQNPITRWTPLIFKREDNACGSVYGSYCTNTSLKCIDGIPCVDNICGGEVGAYSRNFGGTVSFTEPDFERTLYRSKANTRMETEKYLVHKLSSNFLKSTCHPKFWLWATKYHRMLLSSVEDPVAFQKILEMKDEFFERYHVLRHYYYAYMTLNLAKELYGSFAIEKVDQWIDLMVSIAPVPIHFSDLKEHLYTAGTMYLFGETCLGSFPITYCKPDETDPERGTCECAADVYKNATNHSIPYFQFDEKFGECRSREGSICSTVEGFGTHICQNGDVCEHLDGSQPQPVNPLTLLEIRICKSKTDQVPNITLFPTGAAKRLSLSAFEHFIHVLLIIFQKLFI